MMADLKKNIKHWAKQLGFQDILISDPNLDAINQRFQASISKKHHADMEYLVKNIALRTDPSKIVEDTKSIIIARMDYLPPNPKIIERLTR